jgi:hypothetical protein
VGEAENRKKQGLGADFRLTLRSIASLISDGHLTNQPQQHNYNI